MSDITRRDALAFGVSAAALAATGASAQITSSVKAADAPAPSLPIEKGATLRMLRPVRFVQADEDVAALLGALPVQENRAKLRGMAEDFRVFRIG